MNIALVGYGKMGKAIEEIALERGHKIILKITSANPHDLNKHQLQEADVAIEFTRPDVAAENVLACLRAEVPTISGTTGWDKGLAHARLVCTEHNTSFLHATNFSIGVNIFFEVNKRLAELMNGQPSYDVSMKETHHTHKKDSPSGTAITLAEHILERLDRKRHWTEGTADSNDILSITAYREEDVPGTHNVIYDSEIDKIEIIHTAHSRKGFALGAVLAAEFIARRKGVFSMKDVLGM